MPKSKRKWIPEIVKNQKFGKYPPKTSDEKEQNKKIRKYYKTNLNLIGNQILLENGYESLFNFKNVKTFFKSINIDQN